MYNLVKLKEANKDEDELVSIIVDSSSQTISDNDEYHGHNPEEVVRIIQACKLCDTEDAWSKAMGTASDWKPGMNLVSGNSKQKKKLNDGSISIDGAKENNEDEVKKVDGIDATSDIASSMKEISAEKMIESLSIDDHDQKKEKVIV